jgi:hypothetical protein
MIISEDRLILHDLRGVNLKVDFFFGTREDLLKRTKCIAYSVCWEQVDVRIDQLTLSESLWDLDFHYNQQQLFIGNHQLSGEVVNFQCEKTDVGITASCVMLLGKDY